MAKIQILPDVVANQIAAGEVVERPASVVKELIENSIDAGATHIRVRIKHGGRSLISVQDDGEGMLREDAILCLERHATSKIRQSADLAAIHTLGFRGEAIPSISSVSDFHLTTRPKSELEGTYLHMRGGRLETVEAAGSPPGTLVEIKNLFYNLQ